MKQSSGILVYRKKNEKIEILLVHPGGPYWKNKDENCWSIPKGEITLTDANINNRESMRTDNKTRTDTNLSELRRTNDENFNNSLQDNFTNELRKEFANNSRNEFESNSRDYSQEFAKIIKETAIREFEEETGLKLNEKDINNLKYLGEVRSSNKILYVFILKKDFGDDFKVKSNLIELEFPPKSKKFIKIPEVDKAGYFDLKTARKKLVSYQEKIIDKLINF